MTAGNGGAGGIIVSNSYNFEADTYNIVVGAGGTANYQKKGADGGNSSLGTLIAYGGGAGGGTYKETTLDINGSSGGSGGGAGRYTSRILNYAFGTPGETVDTNQGTNGPGRATGGCKKTVSDITGINVTFANANVSAIQNTGSGGLGAVLSRDRKTQTRASQSGAKGIVIIRVPKNASIATTGTVTTKDIAALTPSSTKYVFITNNPTIVLSDQSDGGDLPSLGYTAYRKLGSVTIDSSGHITAFTRSVDNQPWT